MSKELSNTLSAGQAWVSKKVDVRLPGNVRLSVNKEVSLCRNVEGAVKHALGGADVGGHLLVRIHYIIVMIRWTGLAPWEFEFRFPGSLASTHFAPLPGMSKELSNTLSAGQTWVGTSS